MASGTVVSTLDDRSLAEELGNLISEADTSTISVNYASYKTANLPRRYIVESILANADVILFGDRNFTFTFALAAFQGGWSRILSTRVEPATDAYPLPTLDSVQHECATYCRLNGALLGNEQEKIEASIQIINSVKEPMQPVLLCGVDPTSTDLTVSRKVAWFQCPWVPRGSPTGTTASLITTFLDNMARQQNSGDYVLIGITTYFPYVTEYNLGDLLDFTQGVASNKCSCPQYDFLGADDKLVYKILQFGYHHQLQSVRDIHERIFTRHITLVFMKKFDTKTWCQLL